ncbi:hypothetical protein ACVWY5_001317 [Bradyrhizobium sp. USDA 3256]
MRRCSRRWFEAKLDHLAQTSDTAKALRYALRHWNGLTLYLDDGRIEMATNAVERAMRPFKLNAKNSLFASCDEGAESWAVLGVLSQALMVHPYRAIRRKRYGTSFTRLRQDDGGSPSSNTE